MTQDLNISGEEAVKLISLWKRSSPVLRMKFKNNILTFHSAHEDMEEYERALASHITDGLTNGQAIGEIARKTPDLHQRYLNAYNTIHR